MKMKQSSRREFSSRLLLGAAALSSAPSWVYAANYPSKVIKVVVPFSPGGGTDVIGRSLIQSMSEDLGQSMIIENRPGAGTVIGSDYVSKAGGDGHTLLMTTSAIAINASLVPKLPYDTLNDLPPVGRICNGPNIIAVRADSPIKTIADLIRIAKERKGELSYASSGNGSAVHLSAELFKLMTKVDIQHIPYRGAGPAYTDLLGGQVDMLFGTAGGTHKFVKSGQMRAIAVTSATRVDAYAGIPSVSETVPGYSAEVWYGLFASKGTPTEVIDRLSASLIKAAGAQSYRDTLQKDGLIVSVNSPSEMAAFMRAEVDRWKKVVVSQNIKAD